MDFTGAHYSVIVENLSSFELSLDVDDEYLGKRLRRFKLSVFYVDGLV